MADLAAVCRGTRSFESIAALSVEAALDLGGGWTVDAETVLDKDAGAELAQLWAEHAFSSLFVLRIGHFNAPLGRANRYDTAVDFFGITPAEPQNALLPAATWRATGLSLYGTKSAGRCLPRLDYELQLLTLGNAGERPKPGVLARFDLFPSDAIQMGAGAYYGAHPDTLALTTAVFTADASVVLRRLTLRGNAATDRFRRTMAAFEAGYNLMPETYARCGRRLDAFAAYAFTYTPACFGVSARLHGLSAGINLTLPHGLLLKCEYGTTFSASDYVGLALAFIR